MRGVQELLTSLGIASRIYETGVKKDSFEYTTVGGEHRSYGSDGPSYDLRISGRSVRQFAARVGFTSSTKQQKLDVLLIEHDFYAKAETVYLRARRDDGFETTYNLTEPRNHSYIVGGVVVANCSEYMSLDNTSCNLASLNLMKFLNDDDSFAIERFVKAVEVIISAMDISISFADFPTEAIGINTRAYRQLGIGYANLGALLMASGWPTTPMAAAHWRARSRRSAWDRVPAFGGAGRHRRAVRGLRAQRRGARPGDAPTPPRTTPRVPHGVDKAVTPQPPRSGRPATRSAPRTAGAMRRPSVLAAHRHHRVDDGLRHTGVEPDLALVGFKKLVGGGSMQIVNQTVPRALRALGYQEEQLEAIVDFIAENGHVIDARPQARALRGVRLRDGRTGDQADGNVRMMAAAQPFLSGAISKT